MGFEKAFFSFTEVPEVADHRAYNEWHQLDHRPENLNLDGVRWGERWVRSPRCIAASGGQGDLARSHYINLYWFRSPAEAAITEWQALAERSFQWGRRADIAIAERLMMGFFSTVKGYASPRVRVSPEALVFRPNTGVHLSVSKVPDPHSVAAERLAGWYDCEHLPALLELDGVAGAWTFTSDSTTLDPSWAPVPGSTTFEASGNDRGAFRVVLCFLDADPVAVSQEIEARRSAAQAGWDDELRSAEVPVFVSPLESIAPWDWTWFDESNPDR